MFANKHTLSSGVEPISYGEKLPQEIWLHIFSFFNKTTLARAACVSRQFNQLARQPEFLDKPYPDLILHGDLMVHSKWVNCLMILDEYIVSGSGDCTIRLWNLKSRDRKQFNEHTACVRTLMSYQGKIVSGSDDKTIKIINPNTGACEQTLCGHSNAIRALASLDGYIVSGSVDGTIKMWNPENGKCEKTLKNTSAVLSLIIHEGRIICGLRESNIAIWNPKTEQCEGNLQGHHDMVRSLVMFDGKLISGSADQTIKIWNLNQYECERTIVSSVFEGWINSLIVFNNKMICGSGNSEKFCLSVWNLHQDKCEQIVSKKIGWVNALAIYKGRIVCVAKDRYVRIFSFLPEEELDSDLTEEPCLEEQDLQSDQSSFDEPPCKRTRWI